VAEPRGSLIVNNTKDRREIQFVIWLDAPYVIPITYLLVLRTMNKNQKASLLGLFTLSLALVACSGQKGQNAVSASDSVAANTLTVGQTVSVDSSASYLSWKGFKPGGQHYGKLPVSAGELDLKDGVLRAGSVSIQMNGIIVEDLKAEDGADKLKQHLESEDFFDVAKYPEARFELTNLPAEGVKVAELTELQGNLTLKDVTKNITIPVASVVADPATGAYTITSKTFTINRADWNVKYGSKSFFTGLGDKFINDDIELSFVLKTK
jgi:YceI-like domain protein